MSHEYNDAIQFDLDHLSQYEDVTNLEKKKAELDYVYAQADKAAKAEEYEVKAKSFDYARGKLITKIQNLRDRADRADDIEVENELRERLSKFEEVDNNLMAAFVKASFGQEAKEKESSENKGRESLRAKLREKTANALDKKIEHEIKKGSERLWD